MSSLLARPARVIPLALALAALLVTAAILSPSAAHAADADPVVNINEANAQQLAFLPGIGPSRADRIIAYRTKHAFKRVVELARVKGIGLKTVRKLKAWLAISGPTTLTGPIRLPKRGGDLPGTGA